MTWHGSNTLQITSSKTSVTHTFFSLSNTISPILVISFLGNKSWNVSERPLSKDSDEKGKEKKKTSIAIGKLSTLHANAMTTKHTKILKSIEKWNTYWSSTIHLTYSCSLIRKIEKLKAQWQIYEKRCFKIY